MWGPNVSHEECLKSKDLINHINDHKNIFRFD